MRSRIAVIRPRVTRVLVRLPVNPDTADVFVFIFILLLLFPAFIGSGRKRGDRNTMAEDPVGILPVKVQLPRYFCCSVRASGQMARVG